METNAPCTKPSIITELEKECPRMGNGALDMSKMTKERLDEIYEKLGISKPISPGKLH